MVYQFYLSAFAKKFAQYLQGNLEGRLHTDDAIKIDINGENHTLSFDVYLDDQSGFGNIYVGRFSSHYKGNDNVRKWFTINSVLFEGSIHLVYEKDRRVDVEEIPFP